MEIENDKAGKNHNLGVLAALLPTSMSLKVAQVTFNIIILSQDGSPGWATSSMLQCQIQC
jgi:hypothetical protein